MNITQIYTEKLKELVDKSERIKRLRVIEKVFGNGDYLYVWISKSDNKVLWLESNYRKDSITFENHVIEYDIEEVVKTIENKYYDLISPHLTLERLAYYMIKEKE
jgi:predicted RND superfamily exporter protein